MLLKATPTLDNENEILDTAGLLIELRKKAQDSHPDVSDEIIQWAVEQAIMRLSIKTGHKF